VTKIGDKFRDEKTVYMIKLKLLNISKEI